MNIWRSLFNTNVHTVNTNQTPLFQEGKFFYGKVAKLFANDFALVNAAGKTFSAKLEAALSVGRGYLFRVESSKPYPTLRVLASTGNIANNGSADRPVDGILQQLGLPLSAKQRALVSFLMKEGLPFSKAFLQETISWLTDSDMSSSLSTLKMMLTRNLPIQEGVFHALHRVSTRNDNLTSQLNAFIHELSTVQTPSATFRQLREQLANIVKTITMSIQKNQVPVKRLINALGLQYENILFHGLQGRLPANQLAEQLTTLKPTLLALLQEDIPFKAREIGQDMIHRLTGQQLLLKTDDSLLHLLFQLPLPEAVSASDLFIHFQGKQKNNKMDADFCRILFYLELKHLKETVIDVNIQNRIVAIRIYNDTTGLDGAFKPLENRLQNRLHDAGYHLSSLKWITDTNREQNFNEQPSIQFSSRYQGVDVKI